MATLETLFSTEGEEVEELKKLHKSQIIKNYL